MMFAPDSTAAGGTGAISIQQIATIVIPLLVGIGLVPLVDFLKKAMAWIDNLPAPVMQILVAVLAAVGNWIFHLLNVTAPVGGLNGVTATWLGTFFTALVAFFLKNGKSLAALKDAVVEPAPAAPVGKAPPH
jgi:hypothetical protein